MFRLLCASAIAVTLFIAQIPEAAKASTLSYDLTLTPLCCGTDGGAGSFAITTPQVGSFGTLTQTNNGLTAMDFKIDGLDFKLNSSSAVTYFYQGATLVLASIGYSGQIGNDKLLSISLGGIGGYSFSDGVPGDLTIGSMSISATPIPSTLPLLATGLGALGLFGWWRKRKASATALAPG
jgi:hypothetical protein